MTLETRSGEYPQRRTPLARLPRDERRAQLLASALEVFVANGYHGAAMSVQSITMHQPGNSPRKTI